MALRLFSEGKSDQQIAERLTELGYHSPHRMHVLPSTIRTIRLRRRLFRERHQSHPRNVADHLTVSQLARKLDVSNHWVYDRIYNGSIRITKDTATGLYLFPDEPATIERFRDLKEGKVRNLRF